MIIDIEGYTEPIFSNGLSRWRDSTAISKGPEKFRGLNFKAPLALFLATLQKTSICAKKF